MTKRTPTPKHRTPAIAEAAFRYRQLVTWARRSERSARIFATDIADARAFLAALARRLDTWTDTAGRTFALTGPACGCQVGGPPAEPGVWFGGAGF